MSRAVSFLCVMSGIALMSVAALPAAAETIAFWGDEQPATNRVCASSQTAAVSPVFESRLCSNAEASLQNFSSNKFGTVLTVR